MKSLINLRTGAMMLTLILLSGTSAWADVDDYILSVRNVSHSTNTIDFDLYLLDDDNAQAFEFAALQMGLLLNTSIYGTGTLTVSYSNSGSGLDGDQQFVFAPDVVAPLAGYAGKTLIRLMPNSIPPVPPGAGSGTVISSGGNGTLLAHFTITSSVSFTPNSRAGMEFCSGTAVSPLFPTVVYSYIGGNSTPLPSTPGVDAIVDGDPLLNATPPALFNVTGTGTYCVGGGGLMVGVSGSELSTDYTLFMNSIEMTTIPGTGSTLTFGNQTEGTYTVFATNDAGTLQMTGQAVITAVVNTAGTASSTPTLCINTALTAITHATTGATGIGTATGLPAGVSANWSANTITINGTPTASGTFNYTIPLTGGCGSVNATGTFTVTPANTVTLTSGAGTNNQTVCNGTAITNITYSTTGATGATVTGLPTGVTGNWSGGVVTISGTPTAAGNNNYTVTLTGGCGTVTATGSINVTTANTIALTSGAGTNNQTLCVNTALSNITYATTGATGATVTGLPTGVTGTWSGGVVTISGTPTAAGNNNYTVTLTGGCGTVTATGSINVTTANTIALTSGAGTNNQTLCVNTALSNITYATTGATGATVTGLPTGVTGTWSGGVVTISGTPTATGTISYLVTLTGGCGAITASGNINVNALPVTSAITGSATPACSAQGVTYSVTSTSGSTYLWTVPAGATVASGQGTNSITVNFATTNGNVAVTERNTAGCYGTTVTRAVSLQGCGLVANFEGTPLSICVGSSVTFTNTSTGTTPTTTYSWNFGSGATPSAITGIGPHTVTYSTTGAKTISLTITEGASNNLTRTGYISVNPINTVNRTSGAGTDNQTVCVNTAISNITYSTTGATGATFSGFPAGLTMGWSANVVTISGTPSTAGTFNYTVTLTGGCGNISTNGSINVSAINTTGAASSTPTVCRNTAMTPVTHLTTGATGIGTAIGLPTGVTAAWASNTITINGTPAATGIFNYTIPLTGGCGSVNATGTITVTATNTVGAASSTPTLCINTALTAITHATTGATGIGGATGLPAGVSASWAGNTITISGTPSIAGTFNYSIPLSGGCGTINATGTITVRANNTVTAASATPTLCINTLLTSITHSTTSATGIGTATGLPAGVSANWAANAITISGTPTASGTFNYIIPLTGGCGIVNATGSMTVTPANTVSLTSGVGTNNQTVCNGTAITNITYSTTGATGATVTGLPTGVTGNWSGGVVTISGTPTATGTISYLVTLTGGCGAITASGNINVNALPVTSAITGSATPACSAQGVTYSVTSTSGSTYSWTVPAGATVASGQGTNNIIVNFGITNGNVAVTERNAAGCYGTTVTRTISLQGCGLSADFSATPRSVCIGSTVSFTNLSTGTSGSTVYSWSFGSGANPLTATGSGPHSVTYSTSGSKNVTLTITDGASDVETKAGYITVNPANTITLTSAAGTNNQTLCVNTAISNITYSTTGATGATFSGLPTGVNAIWSANIVTINGTPTIVGTYNYIVTLTGGCGNITANGSITVNSCLKTLTLSSVLLEGLYNGSGMMRQAQNASGAQWPVGVADHITVELHDATNYSNIVWSATDVPLSTNGSAIISVPPAYSGTYFITIRHRNSIETTTSTAVSFAGSSIARTFALRSSVFGSNLGASGDGYYVIYGADVNQDGIVDTGDMNDVDNGSTAILIGYNLPDANGDGIVDTSDMNIVDNNSTAIIMIRLP